MNTKTLQLLSQKKPGVEVVLFTENGHGRKGFLTSSVVNDFEKQYPPLRIKGNPDCHDRLIVLDYGQPTEQVFHCGASSKDAGKKRKICQRQCHLVKFKIIKLRGKSSDLLLNFLSAQKYLFS